MTIKDNDLGYLCSIIDTEGYIGISKKMGHNKYRYYLNFTITNTNIIVIEHVKIITKCGNIQFCQTAPTSKRLFYWAARLHESAIILPIVETHLVNKREQAMLGIEYLANCRHKNTREVLIFEQEILKEVLYKQMYALNKRGK